MYITYETAQYAKKNEKDRTEEELNYKCYYRPPKIIPNDLPKPDFMPTKLVRISDMKKVDGSQVKQAYCALSYSWSQSGEMVLDQVKGKYKRIDNEKHQIIFPARTIRQRKKKKRNAKKVKEKVKYVLFEGLLQHIGKQFNIQYLWFDQMCINQNDKEEKKREIRNMHLIYSHAYCTIALVPEFNYDREFLYGKEEYFQRLWTLEEAIKSKRLLFIGRNFHQWGHDVDPDFPVYHLIKPLPDLRVNEILYYAHQRTSTKDHDRVFALLNLFPEFMDKINIDYDQPFENLIIQFYGLLAKKDIRVLFFGKMDDYKSMIQKHTFLPSWTGLNGEHRMEFDTTSSFQNYDVIGKTMHITSSFITNNQHQQQSMGHESLTIQQKKELPPPPDDIDDDDGENMRYYRLGVLVQLPGTREQNRILLITYHCYKEILEKENECLKDISEELQWLSRFMKIKKENLYWCHEKRNDDGYPEAIKIDFKHHLTEDLDDPSAHYVILTEISAKLKFTANFNYHPVIKKKYKEGYYKAIGCCIIKGEIFDFFSQSNGLPKQTFLIQ